MDKLLIDINEQLDGLATQFKTQLPNSEPFNIANNNWSFPGLSRDDLAREAQSLADEVRKYGPEDIGASKSILIDYPRRLQMMRQQLPQSTWANPAAAVPAFLLTIMCLKDALNPILRPDLDEETVKSLQQSSTRARALSARLNTVEPKVTNLNDMVARIESVYQAADQLPTDLASLSEAKEEMSHLVAESEKEKARILALRLTADDFDEKLKSSVDEAEGIVARLQSAYSAATSQGLAAAFAERSKSLGRSMWVWVGGLIIALALGAVFGTRQLHSLIDVLSLPSEATKPVTVNIILSVLSVSAPLWFSWLATKQIGQRFRLSEDYAFKASVSRAYEGYRKEAARIDPDLEQRLLESALSRLDEQPLRLVEGASYGSPWHEFASSDVVKDAVKSIPGFSSQLVDLAKGALERVGDAKKKAVDVVASVADREK